MIHTNSLVNHPERLRGTRPSVSQEPAEKARTHLPKVKIIISLREEYLGALEEFSLAIPQLFEERLRLGPIGETGARLAIVRPALEPALMDGTPYWSPPFEFEPQSLNGIIAFLKGKSGVIEPFQLQLLCQHAEDLAVAKSKAQAQTEPVRLTLADFGDAKGLASVLERFYKDTVNKLPKSQRSKARRLCEEGLVDFNGHRLMLDKEQILSDYRLTADSLESLAHERLLVGEPRLDGIFYEISHDRLAESIQGAQLFRLPRKIRHRLLMSGVIALFIIAVVGWGMVQKYQESIRAEKLLSFMLGEKLQAEMRDVGRGDILELVQEKSEKGLKGASFSRSRGLAFRNSGHLHRSRGHINQAIGDFRQSQEIFEKLAATEGDKARVESARALYQLAEALSNGGRLSEALQAYKQAVQIRRDIVERYPQGVPDELLETYASNSAPALELAEAIDGLGGLYYRTGAISEAFKSHEEAITIALDHLFETTESAGKPADARETKPMPNPIAMKVLASGMGSLSIEGYQTLEQSKGFDAVLFIVGEFLRVKPLSAEPHLAESQMIFWRTISQYNGDEKSIADLKKVSDGLEMLKRVDPKNTLWLREWAVLQLSIGSYVLQNCTQNPQSPCPDKESVLLEAERQNLEGVEQLRALVGKDSENVSWQTDLALALLGRAAFLKEKKQMHERMQALDEAVQISSQSIRDENDADSKSFIATTYQERATAWQDQGNVEKALADFRQARTLYEGLVSKIPDRYDYRIGLGYVLDQEIKLLGKNGDQSVLAGLEKQKAEQDKKANDLIRNVRELEDDYHNHQWDQQWVVGNKAEELNKPDEAIAAYRVGIEALRKDAEADPKRAKIWYRLAQAQWALAQALTNSKRLPESIEAYREALKSFKQATEISPKTAQYQNALGVAHIVLGDALQKNDELEAASTEFNDSLGPLQAASRLELTNSLYHENALEAYARISEIDDKLLERYPERQGHLIQEQEWALRQELSEAWKAKAFSSEKGRDLQNKPLLMARRDLSKYMAFTKSDPKQALPLMEQALIDAEKAVGNDPNNPEL